MKRFFNSSSLAALAVLAMGLAALRNSERLRSAQEEVSRYADLALRAATRDRVAGTPLPSIQLQTLNGNHSDLRKALRDEAAWIIDGERCVGCLDRVRTDQLAFRDGEPILILAGVSPESGTAKLRAAGITLRRVLFDPGREIAGALNLDFPYIQMLATRDGFVRDVDLRHNVAACNWSFIVNHVNSSLEVHNVNE